LLDAGLDSIKFSINAGTRKTYEIVHGKDDWEKVVNIVRFTDEYRKSQKLDCKLAITYVVLSCNKDEIPYLREACGAFVDDIHINKVASNQAGYMLENKEYISMDFPPQASSQAPCFMLFNRAHVSCEGYLTLCCVDYQNYLALADLKTTPLSEAWNNLIFQEMRRRHLSNNLVGTLCHNCINNCMTEIQPLVKAYASDFDFAANHEKNLTKQKNRFHYSESS
jgi:molybdenum cofactor biosynthesis enzyme MoaA